MARVGCGTHTARIVDRDGAVITDANTLMSVEWTRVLDDVSTATVVVQPEGDCCAAMGQIRSWRHNLVIYRQGRPMWEGPIVVAYWRRDGVELRAADILGWLDRRVPHHDIRFKAEDLTTIATWLIEDGFDPDDPDHLVEVVEPTRIRGDRAYQIDVGQTGDHLRDLAETGLDYTAVGRRILLMPEGFCARVGSLTDADFPSGLTVVEDGTALATRWVVHGKEPEDRTEPDVKGVAGGLDEYYGLLERTTEETSVLDNPSALAAARSKLRGSTPAPVVIDTSQETTLAPDAAVDVASLVPGWCVDVTTTTTCRRIAQSLKIQGLTVKEDADGESVAVQLFPAGV
ncbi:hypothetical protein AB0D24_04550 [Streptomyces javensis]|uniref:hypothetical protein n=1 Tax=Streptomyces javensis TaxID=114698 RepID=UPI0033DD7027